MIKMIKSRLIEADKYDIHRTIEIAAGEFISMLEEENKSPSSRMKGTKIQCDRGIGEAAGLNHLITL